MDLASLSDNPAALATIEAARIGADATAHAARLTAAAALGAIAAGGLAYLGAVRQVRLQERAHQVRAVAYRFRLSKVIEEYLAQIADARAAARQQLSTFQANKESVKLTSFRVAKPPTLQDENWEVHALLGRRAVELILVIDERGRRLAAFDEEIGKAGTHTDSHFESGTLTPLGERSDGSAAYAPENAIVDYVSVLDTLHRALADLKAELAEAPRASSWRKILRRLPRSARQRRRENPAVRPAEGLARVSRGILTTVKALGADDTDSDAQCERRVSRPGLERGAIAAIGRDSIMTADTGEHRMSETSASGLMSALLAQNWWVIGLRGVFAILFGLIAIFMPAVTLAALVLLFAAYMFVDGVLAIIAAVRAGRQHERWTWLVLEGVIDLIAGGIAVFWPLATILAFILLMGAWAIVSGVLLTAAALRLNLTHGRWWMLFGGVMSVIWGVLLIAWPLPGALVLIWWMAAYALFFGGALLALAFKLRRRKQIPILGIASQGV
jgi:uncharacterized membrane protein HdeD (DUF308 family)